MAEDLSGILSLCDIEQATHIRVGEAYANKKTGVLRQFIQLDQVRPAERINKLAMISILAEHQLGTCGNRALARQVTMHVGYRYLVRIMANCFRKNRLIGNIAGFQVFAFNSF